jgi:formylglycine-generating enzyme required for sulfatase activity
MLTPGIVLQDRYRIVGTLGQGGMGAVYEATDLRFGSTVALKETLVSGEDLRKAFEREAKLLNKLRHAALPVVFDYFVAGEGEFLVMQYIPGDDLATSLKKNNGPFAQELVLNWAKQLLEALEYLHTQEPPIIHRDIKPLNLKLTPRGEVVLLDFGLSKTSASRMTRAGTSVSVVGYTPQYAPLEQINGAGTDERSDLYSLAATLYHLFTGVPPVDALTRAHNVMNGQGDPLHLANELNTAITASVANALQAGMSMSREQRPTSAATFRAMLLQNVAWTNDLSRSTVVNTSTPSRGNFAATVSTKTDGSSTQPDGLVTVRPRVSPFFKTAIAAAVFLIIAVGGFVLWKGNTTPPSATTQPMKSLAPESRRKTVAPPEATFKFDIVSLDGRGKLKQRKSELGRYFTEDLGEGAAIDMVVIPSGKFLMGSPKAEEKNYPDEEPQHEVTLKQFYMSKFEVTQAQWRAIARLPKESIDLQAEPSKFKGDDLPVENISWEEAAEFCARLSRKSGRVYRLPSESEWEYAARAGATGPFAIGDAITSEVVNYDGSTPYGAAPQGIFRQQTVPVGSLHAANNFGLYDVHGNVWEWCTGEYHPNYQGAPADGSPWVSGVHVKHRVIRGGGWDTFGVDCRSANRLTYAQDGRRSSIGFRVEMSLQ